MPSGAPDTTQDGGDADQQVLGARLGAGQYQMCCVAQDRRSLEGHHIDAADLHPEHGETRGTQRAVQRFRGEGEGLRENALGKAIPNVATRAPSPPRSCSPVSRTICTT